MTTKNKMHQRLFALTVFQLFVLLFSTAYPQSESKPPSKTQIVLLGTGHPTPDPDRSGPATAIIVNETPYLIDFGAGVVRRLGAAAYFKGVKALQPGNMRIVFVTHLHADHTVGYPDLIYARSQQLDVYGPTGIKAMTEHIMEAYRVDREARTRAIKTLGMSSVITQVNAHEISAGVVYKDANVTVTAFLTKHDLIESYGYRFDTPDRSIVITGDTTPTPSTIDACHGCDVLIHEVYFEAGAKTSPNFQKFAPTFHTSTTQLAELAKKAKPGLLILYHIGTFRIPSTCEDVEMEMRQAYSGNFVCGSDLGIY
jgi:ribonuclease BN (tRNA processing enzyme)